MWRNPPCEVYRAATAEEAEALLDFLTSLQPEYAYYISEPSHREEKGDKEDKGDKRERKYYV
jgi:hypothetical protein